MTFPSSFPVFTWVLLGTMGVICSLLFSLIMWRWFQTGKSETGSEPYSNYTFLGYAFLYASGLICCGIAGPPGHALSSNPALVNKEWIFRACFLSLAFAIIAWTLMVIGQWKTIRRYKRIAQQFKELQAQVEKSKHIAHADYSS